MFRERVCATHTCTDNGAGIIQQPAVCGYDFGFGHQAGVAECIDRGNACEQHVLVHVAKLQRRKVSGRRFLGILGNTAHPAFMA